MGAPLHPGGLEGSVAAAVASAVVAGGAARPQAAGPLPGAFPSWAALALLDPPLAADLLHAVPLLQGTQGGELVPVRRISRDTDIVVSDQKQRLKIK